MKQYKAWCCTAMGCVHADEETCPNVTNEFKHGHCIYETDPSVECLKCTRHMECIECGEDPLCYTKTSNEVKPF